jgi:hypothetical protein
MAVSAPGSAQLTATQRMTQAPCRLAASDRDLAVSLLSGNADFEWIDQDRLHVVAGPVRAVLTRAA